MATKRKTRSSTPTKSSSKQPAAKFKKSSTRGSSSSSTSASSTTSNNDSSTSNKKSTPRRVRRKCSFPNCPNRVVQGGVCVTHGAKRKLCEVPGCTKAVKIAGRCSSHGPARRKCDFEGCPRVAVQGGKCLSHGARRRVCKWVGTDGEGCSKNAIVGGMCKKHHDLTEEANGLLAKIQFCMPVDGETKKTEASISRTEAKTNSLGVSLAQQRAAVEEKAPSSATDSSLSTLTSSASTLSLVSMSATKADFEPPTPPGNERLSTKTVKKSNSKKHHHQRGLSVFDEMPIVDAIIRSSVSKEEALAEDDQDEARDDEAAVTIRASDQTVDGIIAPVPEYQASQSVSNPEAISLAPTPSGLPPLYPKQHVSASPAPPSCMYPNKTPKPQVTFALGPASHAASASMSAVQSDDYFSPTLAIFEQMIETSQVMDGKSSSSRLSTPKLSPRIRPPYPEGENKDAAPIYQDGGAAPGSPSTTAVIRKVSSNNIVGQVQGQTQGQVADGNNGYSDYYPPAQAPEPHLPHPQYYQQAYPYGEQPPPQPYQYYPYPPPPPAQYQPYQHPPHEQDHAPRPIPDEDYLSRTVSHDVEDEHNRGYHPSHHHHPQPKNHHHQASVLSPHRRVTMAYSHPVPETPSLNDVSMDPAVMVSGGSHAGGGKALLPKPRSGELEHLFIP